jgi:hypothetical protein
VTADTPALEPDRHGDAELEHGDGLVAPRHRLAGEGVVGLVVEVEQERERGVGADGEDGAPPSPKVSPVSSRPCPVFTARFAV